MTGFAFLFLILLGLAAAGYFAVGAVVFLRELRERKDSRFRVLLLEGETWLARPLSALLLSVFLAIVCVCDIVLMFKPEYITARAFAIVRFDSVLMSLGLSLFLASRHPFRSPLPDSYSYLLLMPSVFFVVFALNPKMGLDFTETEDSGLRVLIKSTGTYAASLWIILCYIGVVAFLIINYIRLPEFFAVRDHTLFLILLLSFSGVVLLFLYQDMLGFSLFGFRNEYPVAEVFAFFPLIEYARARLRRRVLLSDYEEWKRYEKEMETAAGAEEKQVN